MGQVLEVLFGQSSLGISFHDCDLRVVYLNKTLAAEGGRPVDAYLGRPLTETLPAIATMAEPHMRYALDSGSRLVGMRFTIRERQWIASYYPARRPDGVLLGVGVVMYDDTARIEAERRLHESEARYRTLVELSPDGIGMIEGENVTYVNPAGAAILGADASDLVGRSAWDFASLLGDLRPSGSLVEIVTHFGEAAYDTKARRMDGSEVTLSVRSVRMDRGNVPACQSFFSDVSAQRRAQHERDELFATLARERGLFSTVLRELPVGVVVLDAGGTVVLRNDAADQIWGGEWVATPDGLPLVQALRTATSYLGTDVVCGDGETRTLRGTVAPIHAADGTSHGAVATFWDVTALARAQEDLHRTQEQLERRVADRTASLADANERLRHEAAEREAAERQLRVAERLASIGTLAAGVAHEINNPLAAVVATAELARVLIADGERQGEADTAVVRIIEEAHRAGEIVKGLLRFGRDDHPDRWPIDVSDVVRRLAVSPRVRTVLDSCRLRTRLARRIPRIVMNPTELEQIVLNLLQNAVQAGATEVGLQTAVSNGHVRIVVRDDGRGITARDRERIFDPFFTTRVHEGGTGLGLSIVHGIVTRYQGRVEVRSRSGRGTSFTVELPSRAGDADAAR